MHGNSGTVSQFQWVRESENNGVVIGLGDLAGRGYPDQRVEVPVTCRVAESCPVPPGRSALPEDLIVELHMDDEDDGNSNWSYGWIGDITSDNDTTLRFCRTPGTQFHRVSASSASYGTYAVARLGEECPPGSVEMSRYFRQ